MIGKELIRFFKPGLCQNILTKEDKVKQPHHSKTSWPRDSYRSDLNRQKPIKIHREATPEEKAAKQAADYFQEANLAQKKSALKTGNAPLVKKKVWFLEDLLRNN
ncbi:hypothetical protein [Vampirovibrio sp.]|uniref:hypothetical protein n=1 Tax=Vampirovibrio sp. TaxID=2717857 RepID=UPI003593E643